MAESTAPPSEAQALSGPVDGAEATESVDVAIGTLLTPVGLMSVAVSRAGVVAIRWCRSEELSTDLPVVAEPSRVSPALEQLATYFAGRLRHFDLPLDLRGLSRSGRAVLRTLYETVPYGQSVTYGEVAHRSDRGVPARAIGSIMGRNPLPIVIPCHRVLSKDGLGGYSGGRPGAGLETKRWLLTMEGVLPPTLGWIQPDGAALASG